MTMIQNKRQFMLYLGLILAIIVVFNFVSRKLFVRLDLTQNKMYSLSESSKTVIGKLDDRMMAKIYFSEDIPGQLANSRRYLQDILEEYEAYSKGRFHFEFVNPDNNEDAQNAARGDGIPPVQMQVVENDKLEIKNVYMGMVLLYNDKKETIPMLKTTEGLEYDLTSKIKKLSAADLKSLGIVKSNVEGIATDKLQQQLGETYRTRSITLDQEISMDIKLVLMNGVIDSMSNDELYHLDQYLQRGGKLFIGQNRFTADLQQGSAAPVESNIFDFLSHYGLILSNGLVTDKSCGQIQVQQNQGFFRMVNAIEYPVFPIIHNFNKDQLITANLEGMQLFFVNEVTPRDSQMTFTSLMKTSDKSGVISAPYLNIYPMNNPLMKAFPDKRKTLAAIVTGSRDSYFAGHPEYTSKANFMTGYPIEILLISDGQFFNDNRAAGVPENLEFIMNSADYLAGDKELVSIRSRGVTSRPLDELSDGNRRFWKWLNVILPALLVILFGLMRWRRNREQRKFLEELYG